MTQVDRHTKPSLSFRLPLEPIRLLRARERVRDYLHEQGVEGVAIDDVILAVEEAMTNAVRHSEAERDLEIELRPAGADLHVRVRDHGKGFDVDSFDRERRPDPLGAGGRGLYLIGQLMDGLELRRNGGLELRAVKRGVLRQASEGADRRRRISAGMPGDAYWDERQRVLLDDAGEQVATLDWEYRCVFANKALREAIGRPVEDVLGCSVWELFPEWVGTPQEKALRAAMELGRSSVLEHQSLATGDWQESRFYPTSGGVSTFSRVTTERKRRELERDELFAALGESEERFAAMFEKSPFALALSKMQDVVLVDVNSAFERLFGYGREELIGHTSPDLGTSDPTSQAQVAALLREQGFVHDFECVRTTKAGDKIWLSLNVDPLTIGGEHHILTSIQDISGRKRAEETLRASEEKYRAIVETAADGILIGSPDGTILFANQQMADMLGYSVDELEGMSGLDLIAEGWRPQTMENRAALDAGRVLRSEFRLRRKDGEPIWTIFASTPIFDADGTHIANLTTHTDVTERRRDEEALRESERRLRIATEATGLGVQDYDVRSGAATWDARVRELWGVEPDEAVTYETFIAAVHPDDREAVEAAVQACMDPGGPHASSTTYRIVNEADGRFRWLRATWETLFEHDEPVRMIGTVEDITERRRAEEGLRRQAQLLDLASDAIFAWELDGPIVYWSQGAVDLYRFTASHAVGRVSHDLLATAFPDGLPSLKAALLRDGAWTGELSHMRQDGCRIIVESRMRLASLDGRQLVLETNRDITERKQAEEALQKSGAKLQASIESMTDAVFISDTEGNFVQFNEAFATFHRFADKATCAKTLAEYPDFLEVYRPDGTLAPLDQWAVPRALRGETATDQVYTLRRKDTGESWVGSYTLAPLRDEAGAIVGSVVTGRDITEQKQAERALRESEARARSIAQAGRIGLFEWNAATDTAYWSPEHYELFGLEPDSPVSWPRWLEGVHPDDRERVGRNAARLLERGRLEGQVQSHKDEYRYVRPDGTVVWIEADTSLEMVGGEAVIRGAVRDVTERRHAEQALRESEERFRAVQENSLDRFTILEPLFDEQGEIVDFTYVYQNARAAETTGRSPQELVGVRMTEVFPSFPETRFFAIYKQVVETGQATEFDEQYHADGVDDWFRATVTPIPHGIAVATQIVTAQRRAEEALRASEERYRKIVELADEPLTVSDDGAYSFRERSGIDVQHGDERRRFGASFATLAAGARHHAVWVLLLAIAVELAFLIPMGLAPTSRYVLGMPGSLLALAVVLAAVLAGWRIGAAAALVGGIVFWATVAGFGAQSALVTTVISTGIWVAAALIAGLVTDALQDQTRKRRNAAVALARAETQRQVQAGEQERVERLASDLRREREQLRSIIEQADMSIVFLDRDFNFLLVNSTYATTCGYAPDEMVGLNHFDLYPHEENEAIFRQVRDTGEAVEYLAKPFEFPDQPERGVTYWDWRLAPLKDDEGRVEALVFSLVEVTERVRSAMFADALNAINAAIAARLDEEHILATVPQMAGEALGCDAGNVGMRHGETWLPARGWNMSEEFLAERFTSAEAPYAEVAIGEQRPVLLEDFARDPLGDAALAETYGFGAVAVLPMLVNGRGIGCLFFTYRKTHHFTHLEVDFAEKVAVLLSQELENARLLRDTQRVAMMLQENLIHPLPSLEGVELGRVAKPAHAPDLVGGDFSDAMQLDDEHIALLIGDVAGKGIKAAGLTETVRSTVLAYLASEASPASVLDRTNRLLLKTLPPEVAFVTACLAVVDVNARTVRVASAGHPPPVVVSSSSCAALDLAFGVPLGAFACGYEEHEVTLARGDCLVLYTDGVTEARRERELFGEARILQTLGSRNGAGAQETAELVRDGAMQFAGELRDDLEVLVLRLS